MKATRDGVTSMVAVAGEDIDVKVGAVLTVRVDLPTGRLTVHHKSEPS